MLEFIPITIDAADTLAEFAAGCYTRSCDYTPGNLIMWSNYMHYRYAVYRGTLFIECLSQLDLKSPAFLPPIGQMSIEESIATLQEHCKEKGCALRLTAVPEEFFPAIKALLQQHTTPELDGWADYIHSAEEIATLQGKALSKRRNRKKKFIAEHPGYEYSRTTAADHEAIKVFIQGKGCNEEHMRCYEVRQSIATVENLHKFPQPAATIKIGEKIVAFTLGEVWGDTLYIHIEKADRDYPGLNETLCSEFAADILREYPQVTLINREEDLGDPGLRQAKRAYSPIYLINRYEFIPQ